MKKWALWHPRLYVGELTDGRTVPAYLAENGGHGLLSDHSRLRLIGPALWQSPKSSRQERLGRSSMETAKQMFEIAMECARTPGRTSMWSKDLGRYVCEGEPPFQKAFNEPQNRAPLSAAFKLVFLTAAGGTLLFVAICVVTTIIAGERMHEPLKVLISGLLDLAKIGFGAIVGLLGGQAMTRESQLSH
jgi:hypothetical protein